MNSHDARRLAAKLAVAYGPEHFPQRRLELYAQRLEQLELDVAELVVDEIIDTLRFPPTVADIRLRAAERMLSLPAPADAWLAAVSQPARSLPDPVRAALELVGGRHGIRASDDVAAVRSQFLRAYRELREQAVQRAASGDIPVSPREGKAAGEADNWVELVGWRYPAHDLRDELSSRFGCGVEETERLVARAAAVAAELESETA